jgi:hypothetical protein
MRWADAARGGLVILGFCAPILVTLALIMAGVIG